MSEIIWSKSYNYKIFISKWDIAFFIYLGYCKNSKSIYFNKSKHIKNGIYFYDLYYENPYYCKLLEEDVACLEEGLKLVSHKILENCIFGNDTLILLKNIEYSLCYFQKESLTMAIIEWASNEFSFDIPEIKTTFDREKNKYNFNFDNFT